MDNLYNAKKLLENIEEKYWDSNENFLYEYYPRKPDGQLWSYLWGYGALTTLIASYIKNSKDTQKLPLLKTIFSQLELYKADREGFHYYNSHPKKYGEAEPYYDDNAWVILALIDAYELLGDKVYLDRAIATAEYLYYGWNDVIGGIYWREFDCKSSNTCSCGPAIVCSTKLFRHTNDKKYLDWGIKIYDWTLATLQDEDGVYFDNITNNGHIGKAKFTYNTGTMIWSGVELYELTNDKKYLNDASKSAKGAMKFFYKPTIANESIKMLPDFPWFHVYLIQGLLALNKHISMSEELSIIQKCLDYAAQNATNSDGLYNRDWAGLKPFDGEYRINLDQLGTAECFALMIQNPIDKK